MAQALQIDPVVFEEAPIAAEAGATVASMSNVVTLVQPMRPQPMPAWYVTPVVVLPLAGAAFIIGNVLMMIPWSVF